LYFNLYFYGYYLWKQFEFKVYHVVAIILFRSVTSRICRLMCWINGGNEQSFFTVAGDSFRVTSVLYLRTYVRKQLFEAKAAGIFLPCFTRFARARARQKFLVKGAPNNFEGLPRVKADSTDVGEARGSSSFAHIFLALRLVNILLRVAPSVCCPGHYSLSLSSQSSSSLLCTNGRSCRAELHSFARILIVHVTVLFQGKCSRENAPVATITSYD